MPGPVLTPATTERRAAHMKVIAKSFGQEWPEDLAEQEALMAENPILRDQFAKFKPKDVTIVSATESSKKTEIDRGTATSAVRDTRAEREKLTGPASPVVDKVLPPPDEYFKGKDLLTDPYGAKRKASGYPIVETPQFYPSGPSFLEMVAPQTSNVGIGKRPPIEEQFLIREEEPFETPKNFPLQTSDQDVIEAAQSSTFKALDKELTDYGWAYTKNTKEISSLAELKAPLPTKETPTPRPVWVAKDSKDQAKVDSLVTDNEAVLSRRWKGMAEALTNPKPIRRKSEAGLSQKELDVDIFGKNTQLGAIPDIGAEEAKTLSLFRSALIQEKHADLIAHGTSPTVAASEAITWSNGIIGKPQWWQNPSQKAAKLREAPETYSVLGFGVDVYPSGTVIETTPAQMARILNAGSSMVSGTVGSLASEITPGLADARKGSEVAPIKDVTGSDTVMGRALDAGLLNIKTGRGIAEEAYDATTNLTGKKGLDLEADTADAIKKGAYASGLLIDIVAMPLVPGSGAVKGLLRADKELAFAGKVLGKGADLSVAERGAYTIGRMAEENPFSKAIAKRLDLIPGDIRLIVADKAFKDNNSLIAATDLAHQAKAIEESGRSGDAILKELVETNPYGKRMLKELGGNATADEAVAWLTKEAEGNTIFKKTAAVMSKLEEGKINPWALHKGVSGKLFKADDVSRWVKDTLTMNPEIASTLRKAIAEGSLNANPRDILTKMLNVQQFRKELLRTIALDQTLGHVLEETTKLPWWQKLDENPFYLLTAKTAVASEEDAAKILKAARETDIAKAIQEGVANKSKGMLKQAQEADAELAGAFYQSRIPLTQEGARAIHEYISEQRRGSSFTSEILDSIETDLGADMAYNGGKLSQSISTDSARKLIEMQIDDVARLPIEGKLSALSEQSIARLPQAERTALLKPISLRPGWIVRKTKAFANEYGMAGDVSSLSIPAQKALAAMQAEMAGIDRTLSIKIKDITSDPKLWEAYGFASRPTEREAMLALIFIPRPKILGSSGAVGSDVFDRLADANSRAYLIADMVEDLALSGRSTMSKLSDLVSPIAISRWEEARMLVRSELDAAKKALRLELVGEASQFGTKEHNEALFYQADATRRYLEAVGDIAAPHKGKGLHALPASNIEELLAGIYFTLEKEEIIRKHLRSLVDETGALNPSDQMLRYLDEALTKHLSSPHGSRSNPVVRDMKQGEEVALMIQDLISLRFKDIAEGKPFNYIDFIMKVNSYNQRLAGALFQMESPKAAALFSSIDEIAQDIADANQLAKQVNRYGVDRMRKIQTAISKGNWSGLSPDETKIVKTLIESSFDATKIKDSLGKIAADHPLLKIFNRGLDTMLSVQYALMLSLRTRFHGANLLTAPFIMMSTLGGEETAKALSSWLDGARLSAFSTDLAKGGDLNLPLGKGTSIDLVAFSDKAGRAWTWRDLAEVAREGSVLSTQKGSPSAVRMLESNAQFLIDNLPPTPWSRTMDQLKRSPKILVDFAQSFAEFSDGSFRLATLISSLKRGEDVSQALQKSREALFDYGKMSDWERKYIASWFMFYSFTRASTASTFWNLIENPTRVANQLKLAKGMPLWGDDKDRSLFYEQDYMQLRPLLSNSAGFVKLVDGSRKAKGDRVLNYGPPLPAIDSFILLAKILSIPLNRSFEEIDLTDYSTERSNPLLKQVLTSAHKEELKRSIVDNGYMDPRYVSLIRASGQWSWFKDLFDLQSVAKEDPKAYQRGALQSKTTFREENPETGIVTEAVQWRLTPGSPQAMAFYGLVTAAELIGATSILKDYAPLTAPFADISEMGPDLTTSPSELFGATTDSRRDAPSSVTEDVKYKEQYSLKPK